MANATSTKLIERLKENITKKEDVKAIEAAQRQVKSAHRDAHSEVTGLDIQIDKLRDKLEATEANPSSSIAAILQARREVALAETNLAEMSKIMSERF